MRAMGVYVGFEAEFWRGCECALAGVGPEALNGLVKPVFRVGGCGCVVVL